MYLFRFDFHEPIVVSIIKTCVSFQNWDEEALKAVAERHLRQIEILEEDKVPVYTKLALDLHRACSKHSYGFGTFPISGF